MYTKFSDDFQYGRYKKVEDESNAGLYLFLLAVGMATAILIIHPVVMSFLS